MSWSMGGSAGGPHERPETMEHALGPTGDPAWVLDADGYDPLRESSVESRFAISNGFLGIRGARATTRKAESATNPSADDRMIARWTLSSISGQSELWTTLTPFPRIRIVRWGCAPPCTTRESSNGPICLSVNLGASANKHRAESCALAWPRGRAW